MTKDQEKKKKLIEEKIEEISNLMNGEGDGTISLHFLPENGKATDLMVGKGPTLLGLAVITLIDILESRKSSGIEAAMESLRAEFFSEDDKKPTKVNN